MVKNYAEQRSVFFDDSTLAKDFWHPPKGSDPEKARQDQKDTLSQVINLFGKLGFGEGIAGHLSVRDPIDEGCFWVNPVGRSFSSITAQDLTLVNKDGDIIEGKLPINKSAFSIHSEVHQARKEVGAVVHAHTTYGKVWSSLGRLLDPINQDACVFFEDHAIHDAYEGVVNNKKDSTAIADTLKKNKALILQNHGLLTVGQTIEEAAWWFVIMERSCEIQILAETVGNPKPLPDHVSRHTRDQIGTPYSGWLSMQPLLEEIRKKSKQE